MSIPSPSPLRCDDVLRELAAPTLPLESSAVAAHLAACPTCAEWADRDAALMRAWDQTRPVEPSTAAWNAVWSTVATRLDRPAAASEVLPMAGGRSWQRLGLVAFSLAQAAAILLAVGLTLSTARRPSGGGIPSGPLALASPTTSPAPASAVRVALDIEPGEDVLIHWGEKGEFTVAQRDDDDAPTALDDNFTMFNAVEAIANETAAE